MTIATPQTRTPDEAADGPAALTATPEEISG
jgi:hypothetical protein